MRRWKKKYFVLDNFLLRYYHDAKEITAGTAPAGIVTLSNCSILKGGVSETFGAMKINLSDGAAGRLYCFSGPDAEDVIDWYNEIKSVVELRNNNNNASSSMPPSSGNNVTDSEGLRRRFTSNQDDHAVSGGEGDHEEDDDDWVATTRASTTSMEGTSHKHGRPASHSAGMDTSSSGSHRVMNLLRSRGLSHGYGSRKKNKRLQQALKAPLAASVKQLVSLYREADAWQLLGVEDDVRVSLLHPKVAQARGLAFPTPIDMSLEGSTTRTNGGKKNNKKNKPKTSPTAATSKMQKKADGTSHGVLPVIRGVCIIKAPPSAVSRLIMDTKERGNWDPHFSAAEEVGSCFPRTQIVRLKGRLSWRRPSGSPLNEVCQRVAEQGVGYLAGPGGRGCCGQRKIGLCGCRDVLLGNSTLLSVVSNATLAGGISGAAAYGASLVGADPTLAAVAGAAVAGAACWHSDDKSVSGTGVLGVDHGGHSGRGGGGGGGGGGGHSSGGNSGNGRWSVGPMTWDIQGRASDRTVLAVQHLCTMGRDSDVILERSVVSNNTEYNGTTTSTHPISGRKMKKKNSKDHLNNYVVGTFGMSGWIIEPLVVRERVVSQVTYVASLDGGGWLPTPLNASLVMERLSCLTCLKALASQTLDTDSWGAEMDLARRPGDLWEPGAEKYWTDDGGGGGGGGSGGRKVSESSGLDSNSDTGLDEDDDGDGRGGDGNFVGGSKKLKAGITMKQSTFDSSEPNTWANYQSPDFVVRAKGYLDSSHEGYKQKGPSGQSCYDCVTVDIFPTEGKTPGLSKYFEMPQEIKEKQGETSGVPHTFCYNAMMPAYKAAMWGKTEGRSHNLVAW